MSDQHRNWGRVGTAALTLAIFAAPFLALLYGLVPALVVMAIGLAAASYLLQNAVASTPIITTRRWVRFALLVNLTLAAACLVAAVWLVIAR